jgi:hypothetical protein
LLTKRRELEQLREELLHKTMRFRANEVHGELVNIKNPELEKKTNSVEDIIDWVEVYPQESIDGRGIHY